MSILFDRAGFIKRLNAIRLKAGLSKGEFSKAIGVSQAFSRYSEPKPGSKERKIKYPSAETLLVIKDKFNASVDWLLTGEVPRPASEPSPPIIEELEQLFNAAKERAEADPDFAVWLKVEIKKALE